MGMYAHTGHGVHVHGAAKGVNQIVVMQSELGAVGQRNGDVACIRHSEDAATSPSRAA